MKGPGMNGWNKLQSKQLKFNSSSKKAKVGKNEWDQEQTTQISLSFKKWTDYLQVDQSN